MINMKDVISHEPTFIKNYNKYVGKIKMICSDNRNRKYWIYDGIRAVVEKDTPKVLGIVIHGYDNNGYKEFEKFITLKDIENYYYKNRRFRP